MSNRFKAVAPSASTVTSRGAALRIKPLYAAVLAAGIGAASLAHADDALQLNTLSIEGNVPEETVSPDASAGTQIITAEQLKSQPKTDLKEMLATACGRNQNSPSMKGNTARVSSRTSATVFPGLPIKCNGIRIPASSFTSMTILLLSYLRSKII